MQGLFNNMKTVFLMGLMMGLCLAIGYALGGGPETMLIAFAFGGVMNIIAFFFSDKIALATVRAQEIAPEDDPALYEMVRVLAERAGIPTPRVYMSPAQAPNAFATGRGPRHSAVCVTAGLRRMLNDEELAGVVAHELSHVKHRDILISTVAAIMAGAIAAISRMAFWFGLGGRNRREGNPLIALLLLIFAPIAAMLIQMAISRSREFEADRRGAELVGSPRGLARALEKLHHGNSQIPLAVPETQANMFIVAPFAGGKKIARMFMTHPPTEERVRRLMAMER